MKGPYYIRKRPDLPPPPMLPCPDWKGIVLALRGKGVSLNGLAVYIGRSREHVYSLLDGTSLPEWYSGQLLIHLAKEMGLTPLEEQESGICKLGD